MEELILVFIRKLVLFLTMTTSVLSSTTEEIFEKSKNKPLIWVALENGRSLGKLHYLDAGHIVYTTSISSGAPKFRTPAGTYKVYYKKRHHMSTKYPEASGINNMDYSLFFLNGFALHQGNPRQQSHGCVHVAPKIAGRLYTDARHGTPVIVTRSKLKTKKKKKKRLFQSNLNYILEDF